MWRRSSAIQHSLLVVDSSCNHNWCLLPPDGTVLEDVVDCLFCFFAIAECRIHDANSLHARSQATMSYSKPEYSGLLMSCQTADWVCRGVVISNGSSALTYLEIIVISLLMPAPQLSSIKRRKSLNNLN